MNRRKLYQLAYQSLLELSTEEGINASGQNEAFGCIFGRDSAITILKILRAHKRRPNPKLLEISRRALLTLVSLQGKEINVESGEQPGKFIHELRRSRFEHLTSGSKPWHVYPDGVLRNYDSIDSTPLTLIALYKYWQATADNEFLLAVLPAVEMGLLWLMTYGDPDKDGLLEYDFPDTRKSGGLAVQSWTDSHQALVNSRGFMPKYPIAPIEAQSFAFLALCLWAELYAGNGSKFARTLISQARKVKKEFNRRFIFSDQNLHYGAQALDGDKNPILTVTANPLLCLWAAYQNNGKTESVVDSKYIQDFVRRAFLPDLFLEDAGIRTMSSLSPTFNPNQDSYHNGSFWPMLNGLIIEGLENFSFTAKAKRLTTASLLPMEHFGSPIELYIKTKDQYLKYRSSSGQESCHTQAWSAAAILDMAISDSDTE